MIYFIDNSYHNKMDSRVENQLIQFRILCKELFPNYSEETINEKENHLKEQLIEYFAEKCKKRKREDD